MTLETEFFALRRHELQAYSVARGLVLTPAAVFPEEVGPGETSVDRASGRVSCSEIRNHGYMNRRAVGGEGLFFSPWLAIAKRESVGRRAVQ